MSSLILIKVEIDAVISDAIADRGFLALWTEGDVDDRVAVQIEGKDIARSHLQEGDVHGHVALLAHGVVGLLVEDGEAA